MLRRHAMRLSALIALILATTPAALAQFPSEVVGFNGPPIDDPATSQEMFRVPEFSGTTRDFIVLNSPGAFDNNAAFRASGLQTEGAAALEVFFNWVDPSDPTAWVRLTTFAGPERPNPSLHLAGKVRFKITNRSELFAGEVGICIGIRETGENVPQLFDGGTVGTIEWVGATGVVTDPNGVPIAPIPAVTIPPSPSPVSLEFDLATGIVKVNGVPQGGGIFGFTGDGVLSAPNDRGTLEHIAIVNVASDSATLIDLAIDELQFEAPVPDPVLPPTVVAPIIAGDTQVTVTDLLPTVDQVNLLRNHTVILTQNVTSNADVTFTLPQPAVAGEVYTATQRDSVTGNTSAESDPVTVLPEASPYGISFVLDEDGDGSCSFDPPGGWEFVGASNLTVLPGGTLIPEGMPLFINDAMWQTVDIPLDDPALVQAWIGGNGMVDPSPTGVYTMDTIWFNIGATGDVGPHEVLIDAIQVIDPNDHVLQTIHDFEDGVRYMSQVRGQSNTNFTSSDLTTLSSYDGLTSHRVEWTFPQPTDAAIGLLTRVGFQCGTSPQFTDQGNRIRFHLLVRRVPDPNALPIPEVVGPIVAPQDTVQVLSDPAATAIQLYVNGDPVGAPVTPGGTATDFTGLTLNPGDSVSATQTIGGVESGFAYPKVVLTKPPAPTVIGPIFPGATSVDVTNILNVPHAAADFVAVYRDGQFAGSAAVSGDPTSVPITLGGPLTEGEAITATQFVHNAESDPSPAVVVGIPGPTIFMAPAEDATSIRVIDVDPNASTVEILVNGGATVFSAPGNGTTSVEVPVSGLVAGDIVTARMTVGGNPSGESDPETVTVATSTPVLCDDFEYDQATYDATWQNSGTHPRLSLSTVRNTTAGGQQSLFGDADDHRIEQPLPSLITPTPTEPVVWNVNIYDTVGPGASGEIWAQIIELNVDFFLVHMGYSSLAGDTNFYQFRAVGNGGPNWIDLNEFEAPQRSIGWHNFTMVHKGQYIDVYVDGKLAAKNVAVTGGDTTLGTARIGSGLSFNTAQGWFDDYCIELGKVHFGQIADQPPAPPVIVAPIQDGDSTVDITGIDPDVTLVEVLDPNSNVLGSATPPFDPNTPTTITLSRPLVHLEQITARATNAFGTTASQPLEVGIGNGEVLIALGIRETGDTGPIGSPGSSTGEIEWIGATTTLNGAPQGVPVSVSDNWQTLTFDPLTDPVLGFTGDGVITATRGTLEHIAIAVNAASASRSSGLYDIFIDNVVNVGAGPGGTDVVIEDFESNAVGDEVLFQEPTFSGSTAGHLTPLPSASEVSDLAGNPGQSERLVWFFLDTTDQRWVRLTTASALNRPQPIIDLTRPIRFDILIGAATPQPCPGDLDGDGQRDLSDLATLLANFGTTGATPDQGDIDGDGDVDLSDLATLLSFFGTPCP